MKYNGDMDTYTNYRKRATKKVESPLSFLTQKNYLRKANINYTKKGEFLYVTPEDYDRAMALVVQRRR